MHILLITIIVIELLLVLYFLVNKKIEKDNKILLLFSIITLSILFLSYYIKIDIFNKIINRENLLLLIITILLAIVLQFSKNYYLLSKKYDDSLNNLSDYESIINEQGKMNHEYKNQLMILKGYINDKNKIREYIDLILEDHTKGQNFKIKQLSKFQNGGIKEMLYYKISKIKGNNLKYYLYVSKEASSMLESLNIKLYSDITKVFGVIIDNAINGASESKEKELSIDFSKDGNYIVITISNSYNKNSNKTTLKKDPTHGFGLRLVKDIVMRNKKLEVITDKDDKYYIQTILIDYKR